MWAHYCLTFYRAMTRHRLYAALNVLGLAVGIAVFLVLWLDVRFETSFERWIQGTENIYQIRTAFVDDPASGVSETTAGGLLEQLHADYPQLIGTRDLPMSATVRQGGRVTSEHIDAVDPDFFKVFDLPLLVGDRDKTLKSPDEIVLTEAKAKQYFGRADPVGQSLTMTVLGATHIFRVAGVIPTLPRNTERRFDFLVLLPTQISANNKIWQHLDYVTVETFLAFKTPGEARNLAADLNRFVDRHADYLQKPAHDHVQLRVAPLLSMHLINSKNAATVAATGLVGILTAVLAAVNYVNLATVSAGLRAREVALRKVLGATAPALRTQFLGEAMATAALAGLIALCFCELALPFVNAVGGLALKLDYWGPGGVLPLLIVTVIVIGLGAGLYPALVLSRFQPAAVLASSRSPGGGRASGRVREALVVFQFAVAVAITIGASVIVSQTNFVRRADLGFQRGGLVIVNSFGRPDLTNDQRSNLLSAWRGLPGVTSIAAGDTAPGYGEVQINQTLRRPGSKGAGQFINMVTVGPDFFKVYGIRLIAGRLLDTGHGEDNFAVSGDAVDASPAPGASAVSNGVSNIVLNANAVSALGFRDAQDALGKVVAEYDSGTFLRSYVVAGVIDNFRFGSPRSKVKGALLRMNFNVFDQEIAAVRYDGAAPQALTDQMQNVWRRIAPDVPFRAAPSDENLQHYYEADEHQGHLFTIGAALAVLIGCVGLFGLASFNTQRRYKEIGIRKTLGASTADILRLLIGQFLRPVLLANLVAWPLAFLTMRTWLSSFDQKIALGPSYFLAAAILTLLIALGTVAGQAFGVARSEPAKALRQE